MSLARSSAVKHLSHETDQHGSPLGSKGIGELGICGAGAAVMNAIHNATGARIRDFPATPDKLLAALEALDLLQMKNP